MKVLLLFLSISTFCFSQQPIFNAQALVCLSDGDSAPVNLLTQDNFVEKSGDDKAYIINFPVSQQGSKNLQEFKISNSIFSGSDISEVSNNTPKLAFILETKAVSADGSTLVSGGYISIIDVTNPTNSKPLFKFPVAANPLSISLNPTGEYLAVASEEVDNEIQVIEINSEGKPVRVIKKPTGLRNERVTNLCWSPDGEFLVYSNETKKEIGLLKVVRDAPTNKIIRLQLFGEPIKLGLNPGSGKFTPDGKYYIASDLKAKKSDQNNTYPAELFVVKFNFEENQPHYLLSKAEVGLNLEEFVIHPNGHTVFALTSNKSFYSNQLSSSDGIAQLHLLDISTSGAISNLASYDIKGRYPSGLAMDSDGSHLAVSISEYPTYGISLGGVQFWDYIESPEKQLIKQNVDFFLPTGVHHLKTIK